MKNAKYIYINIIQDKILQKLENNLQIHMLTYAKCVVCSTEGLHPVVNCWQISPSDMHL